MFQKTSLKKDECLPAHVVLSSKIALVTFYTRTRSVFIMLWRMGIIINFKNVMLFVNLDADRMK